MQSKWAVFISVSSLGVAVASLVVAFWLGLDANEIATQANETAQQALEQSNSFSAINAEVQWNRLLEEYEEVDTALTEWEKSQKLARNTTDVPETQEDLEKFLATLGENLKKAKHVDIPQNVLKLYRKRYRKYETLKNVAQQYGPFIERLARVDFTLPSPPKIPTGAGLSPGASLSGGASFR